MDFTTAVSRTARVTINGIGYDVPRFLLPEFERWAADRAEAAVQRALSEIKEPEMRAKFLMWNVAPPIDVALLVDEARTPTGIKFVIDFSLDRAGVPSEVREALLINGDPLQLRKLAELLLSAADGAAALKEESGDPGPGGDPLTGAGAASEGAPATGATNAGGSSLPTTATQAA